MARTRAPAVQYGDVIPSFQMEYRRIWRKQECRRYKSGLRRCGEREFARDMARRFADMACRSGFAENFDALTGEGLRDRAYTWTASAFLAMAEEVLK